MAIIAELTPENQAEWEEWKKGRPQAIQDLAEKFPPWKLYRMKSSGHRVVIISYSEFEDGTVGFQVYVSGEYNRVLFSRAVFGIKADDLEECDLPAPGEVLGDRAAEAGYTDDDVRNILIPKLKEQGAFSSPSKSQ